MQILEESCGKLLVVRICACCMGVAWMGHGWVWHGWVMGGCGMDGCVASTHLITEIGTARKGIPSGIDAPSLSRGPLWPCCILCMFVNNTLARSKQAASFGANWLL